MKCFKEQREEAGGFTADLQRVGTEPQQGLFGWQVCIEETER